MIFRASGLVGALNGRSTKNSVTSIAADEAGRPEIKELVGDRFTWPDMQYVTMRWSGQWHSVDVKYSGFNGYPNLAALHGTHYAGVKPWYFKRDPKTVRKFSRYEDFRY